MTAYALEYPVGASPTAAPKSAVTIVSVLPGSLGYIMSDGTITSSPPAAALEAYNAKYHAEHPETWSIADLKTDDEKTYVGLSLRIDSLPKNLTGWSTGGFEAAKWLNGLGYTAAANEVNRMFGYTEYWGTTEMGPGLSGATGISLTLGYDSARTGTMSPKRPPWLGGGRPKTSGA
jgi:hypothetical protein